MAQVVIPQLCLSHCIGEFISSLLLNSNFLDSNNSYIITNEHPPSVAFLLLEVK